MHTVHSRMLIVFLTGFQKFNLRLTRHIHTWKRQPATHPFTCGYRIGFNSQRVSDPKTFSLHKGCLLRTNRTNHFRQMSLIHLFATAERASLLGDLQSPTYRINPEKIRCRIAEIALLPVDEHTFQGSLLLPLPQLCLAHVGDILLDIGFHLRLCPTEIQAQPMV